MAKQPDWDDQHMRHAIIAAQRSSCLKRRVGAALMRGKRIIAMGYNGAPPNTTTCIKYGYCVYDHWAHLAAEGDPGRFKVEQELHKRFCIATHAEANALLQCSQSGELAMGAVLYTTNFPCPDCTKLIIGTKLGGLVYWKKYLEKPLAHMDEFRFSMMLLKQAKVPVRQMNNQELMEIFGPKLLTVGERTEYVFDPSQVKKKTRLKPPP
jgi:dCMP deaminase